VHTREILSCGEAKTIVAQRVSQRKMGQDNFALQGISPKLVSQSGSAAFFIRARHSRASADPEISRSVNYFLQLQRRYGNRYVQRVVHSVAGSKGRGEVAPDVEKTIDRRRAGQRLVKRLRLRDVRVHIGKQADVLDRTLSARALTTDQNVFTRNEEYDPSSPDARERRAHELTHGVQQRVAIPGPIRSEGSRSSRVFRSTSDQAGAEVSNVIQRAGDPAAIPPGFSCPTDLSPGRPAGTDVLFSAGRSSITPAHRAQLTTFQTAWLTAGGTDDILVHGYASTEGDQGPNWTLSCDRAEAVQAELVRLGIPAVRISVVAHGESTDFGASRAPNRHAVVSSRSAGILPLPLVAGVLTPRDNFAGRSATRFGVGEVIDLSFASFPPRPAADFGGLEWRLAAGGGALSAVTDVGTATYTAPAAAGAGQLELRVASGATAGRVISSHAITIVIPSAVNMVAAPGSAPSFAGWGAVAPIPAGTWGAGFRANVFVDPKDVSFQGVVFGEATVPAVVTPAGSFLSVFGAHPANTFGPAHGGNATTGTAVSPPQDGAWFFRSPARTIVGVPICGVSDLLWAIPWEFSVAGGPRTRFAGGFTANQHTTSTVFCDATIEKAGAGPFCRSIDGSTC